MSDGIWQVCSLIIQVKTDSIAAVSQSLIAFGDTDIVATDADRGKMVVVMSATDGRQLLEKIESTRNLGGVLAVSLVYHQQDEQDEDNP